MVSKYITFKKYHYTTYFPESFHILIKEGIKSLFLAKLDQAPEPAIPPDNQPIYCYSHNKDEIGGEELI